MKHKCCPITQLNKLVFKLVLCLFLQSCESKGMVSSSLTILVSYMRVVYVCVRVYLMLHQYCMYITEILYTYDVCICLCVCTNEGVVDPWINKQ